MDKGIDQENRLKRNEERDPANDKLDWFNFETRIRKLIQVREITFMFLLNSKIILMKWIL